jgi:hypothetical protein
MLEQILNEDPQKMVVKRSSFRYRSRYMRTAMLHRTSGKNQQVVHPHQILGSTNLKIRPPLTRAVMNFD